MITSKTVLIAVEGCPATSFEKNTLVWSRLFYINTLILQSIAVSIEP